LKKDRFIHRIDRKDVLFLVLVAFIVYMGLRTQQQDAQEDETISGNTYITMAKVTRFAQNGAKSCYFYTYCLDNKVYEGSDNRQADNTKNGARERCVGNFYKIHIATNNPLLARIYLDSLVPKEAVDSTLCSYLPDRSG